MPDCGLQVGFCAGAWEAEEEGGVFELRALEGEEFLGEGHCWVGIAAL